jgi:hypothetical protein
MTAPHRGGASRPLAQTLQDFLFNLLRYFAPDRFKYGSVGLFFRRSARFQYFDRAFFIPILFFLLVAVYSAVVFECPLHRYVCASIR